MKTHKKRKIYNPKHYFNRYIACEVKIDRKNIAKIREAECSLEEKLETETYPNELICNIHGELFDEIGGFLDKIENERLYEALCTLSSEQLKLIILVCDECLTQREIAKILGVSQKTVSIHFDAICEQIVNHLKKA